jgi:hypothetical protein
MRDVIFDEETVFDGKKSHANNQLIAHMDELVARISLESPQVKNEEILEVDKELLSLESTWESDDSNVEQNLPVSEEDEDIEIAHAVEEGLITPPPSEVESKDSAFAAYIPFQSDVEDVSKHKDEVNQGGLMGCPLDDGVERFESFQRVRIGSAFHGTFENHRRQLKMHKRELPPPPKTAKDLENHPYRKKFEAAQNDHLRPHDKMRSWLEVDKTQAKGHQMLGCMWRFVYKTDKHGYLQKVKARLVVWGHQQAQNGLPTRATTFASTTFRNLMAITAKYDLETRGKRLYTLSSG